MNKTFKIVFNKARGALMVANEITSSVQKKGVKLIVAATAAAACGASTAGTGIANDTVHFATDATISTDAPSGEPNRYSGIAASENGQTTTVSVADGATLTITGTLENFPYAERLYLISAQTGSAVTTSGTIVGQLSADTSSGEVRGIRANGGDITINGSLNANLQSSEGNVYGADAWYGSHLTFNGQVL